MKFYNPFKKHIAYNPEYGYCVRRANIFGWEYLDSDCKFWWCSFTYAKKWAMMDSLEEAKARLTYKEPKWSFVE
jgi:hypothetical protein